MLRFVLIVVAAMLFSPAAATEAGWALLRDGGHVVLLRHAMAPSAGDPASFDIADCSSRRNLTERGREQADRLGVLLSVRAARTEGVLTSRYCRCLDTAEFAFDDLKAEVFDALDPLPADPALAKAQEAAIVARAKSFSGSGNLVMITHKENIAALTGVSAREGEAVIVGADGDGLRALGRILFD
jgi:phosphohistidine phosphatase SixA